MKIAHRPSVPRWFAAPESDPVDDDYAADVERMTDRAEREFRQLRQRLERTEKRLARARTQKPTTAQKRCVKQLQALVSQRRAELAEYERLMMTPVTADKQIRQRTGLDDHLELGIRKRAPRPQAPNGPVTIARKESTT